MASTSPTTAIPTSSTTKTTNVSRPSRPTLSRLRDDASVDTSSETTSGMTVIRSAFTQIVPIGSTIAVKRSPIAELDHVINAPTARPSASPTSARMVGDLIGKRPEEGCATGPIGLVCRIRGATIRYCSTEDYTMPMSTYTRRPANGWLGDTAWSPTQRSSHVR